MTELSNGEKNKHGKDLQAGVEVILRLAKERKHIISIESPYRIGRIGFENEVQFYTPFLITFKDNTKWALFTTTSLRTDRIKEQQWDALNLKSIDQTIKRAYLVFSDALSDDLRKSFEKQNNKYIWRIEYSALDGVVSQNDMSELIAEYAMNGKTIGQIKDIQGNDFEHKISAALSYEGNLEKWKFNKPTSEGAHYNIFESIVNKLDLDKTKVTSIRATAEIPALPTRGKPKTDVLLAVCDDNIEPTVYSISCKRSSAKSVSVHQYSAQSFSEVLDPNNNKLYKLLVDFQNCGSKKALGNEKERELTEVLKPYVRDLCLWAIGGIGGKGNPDTQWAKFIITYSNEDNKFNIESVEEFCNKIITEVNGDFGTPFQWTYASGCKGKNIQLKCRIR